MKRSASPLSPVRGCLVAVACLFSTLLTVEPATAAERPVLSTPDQLDMRDATRSLMEGYERSAFEQFLEAARYGNKEAQKNIGLMYIKGMGVSKDWPKACAWMMLASSLGEPAFVEARNLIWRALRDDEREAAKAHYRDIVTRYGDQAALERRQSWVLRQKREITGSRTGNMNLLRIQVADDTGYVWELWGEEYFSVLDTYVSDLEEQLVASHQAKSP